MFKPENVAKPVDGVGRVCIPKGLRNRLCIETGDKLEIYTLEVDDKTYICLVKE